MPPLSAKRKEQLANEIRQIRKRAGNLVCVDCPSRNTSYVCVKFNTFVCTNCSGLYRKYTFRVKSVSVAEFTEDEVERLRNGGNKVCNNLYMAKWRKRDVLPKGDDLKVLDAFIERKYVKKEWFSEKGKKSEKKKKKKRKKKIVEESESSEDEDKTASEEEKEKKKKKKDRVKDKAPAPVAKKKSSEPDQLLDLDTMFADGPPQPINNAPQQSNNDFGGDDWGFGDNSSAPTTQPNSGRPRQDTWDPFGEKVEQQPPPQQAAPPADDFFGGWGNPGPSAAAPQQPPQQEVQKPEPTPPKKPFVDPFSSLLGSSDPPPTTAAPTSQPAGNGGMYQNNQNGFAPNNQGGAQANPYGGQNAFGQHQSPMMGGYGRGAPVGNPYAPQGVQQNPYGGNPYAPAPANNPYANGGNPYNPGQPSNPYAPAQPQMGAINYGMGTLDIGPPVSGGVSADNPFA